MFLMSVFYSSGYSPAVRAILELYAIDGTKIQGSGRHGKLLKGDVLYYISQNNLSIKPPNPGNVYYSNCNYSI